MDLRVLAWKTTNDHIVLVYVDHHDQAYSWAERNNSKILAAETVAFGKSELPRSVEESENKPNYGKEIASKLKKAGVPRALCKLLENVNSEWQLMEQLELVAPEWQELIIDAVTGKNQKELPKTLSNIWISPGDEALEAALSLPFSQWRVFLHPVQQEIVYAGLSEDIVIVGGPGTGKTVCLVHRAVELSRYCGQDDCVVLVGHSPSAVDVMHEMVVQLAGYRPDSLILTHMIKIGRNGKSKWGDVVGPKPHSNGLLQTKGKDVLALLIDEAQDVHKTTRAHIFGKRPEVKTHLTISVDFNQNIFADNRQTHLLDAIERGRTKHLNYSYRIPRESGSTAVNVITKSKLKHQSICENKTINKIRKMSRKMNYGFTTSFSAVKTYEDLNEGIVSASHMYDSIGEDFSEVGVIFCGNSSDRKRYEKELDRIRDCKGIDGLITPRMSKGKEFDYCIIIAPELMFRSNTERYKAINSLYVAISRSRRGFTIFTTQEFASRAELQT
jgi:hypothetical protein